MKKELSQNDRNRLLVDFGGWALVTGASSGIGKELSTELAASGFNLLLVARRIELLEDLASSLEAEYGVRVKYLSADLSKPESNALVTQAASNHNINLVFLNAGFGSSGPFIESELRNETNMLDLNCKSVLILSHYFSKKFAAQNKGGIVLLSSIVAFQGAPHAAHYAATKAYVQSLGEALSIELKNKKVSVLVASPGPVNTGFMRRANMKPGNGMKSKDIAIEILQSVGRKSQLFPGFLSKLLIFGLRSVPRWGKIRIMNKVMSGMAEPGHVS